MINLIIPSSSHTTHRQAVLPVSDPACEFHLIRTLEAGRLSVFKAWTDPQVLAEWWGPHAYTNPVCEINARQAGQYRIVMRCPDGIDYPLTGTFLEMAEPERLVMTMDVSEHSSAWQKRLFNSLVPDGVSAIGEMILTTTFHELRGTTTLSICVRFPSPELRHAFVNSGMSQGWNESLDSLNALLPHLSL